MWTMYIGVLSQSLRFLRAFQHREGRGIKGAGVYSRNPFVSLGHFNIYKICEEINVKEIVAIPSFP